MQNQTRKRVHSFKCCECGGGVTCMFTIMSSASHYEPEPIKCPFQILEAKFKAI